MDSEASGPESIKQRGCGRGGGRGHPLTGRASCPARVEQAIPSPPRVGGLCPSRGGKGRGLLTSPSIPSTSGRRPPPPPPRRLASSPLSGRQRGPAAHMQSRLRALGPPLQSPLHLTSRSRERTPLVPCTWPARVQSLGGGLRMVRGSPEQAGVLQERVGKSLGRVSFICVCLWILLIIWLHAGSSLNRALIFN